MHDDFSHILKCDYLLQQILILEITYADSSTEVFIQNLTIFYFVLDIKYNVVAMRCTIQP